MKNSIYIDVFPTSREARFTAMEHSRNDPEAEFGNSPIRLHKDGVTTFYLTPDQALHFVRGLEIEDFMIRPNVEWNRDIEYLVEILESRKRG